MHFTKINSVKVWWTLASLMLRSYELLAGNASAKHHQQHFRHIYSD
jgi:hypothetical protein